MGPEKDFFLSRMLIGLLLHLKITTILTAYREKSEKLKFMKDTLLLCKILNNCLSTRNKMGDFKHLEDISCPLYHKKALKILSIYSLDVKF